MKKTIAIIILLLFAKFAIANSGECNLFGSKNRLGLMVGYGSQTLGPVKINSPANYKVVQIKGQYYVGLKNWSSTGIDLLFQPQLNFTSLETTNESNIFENGLEFGINVGILARKTIFGGNSAIYALISAGPHFITKSIETQAKGFIFSDNLAIGFNQKVSNKIFLDFRFGYRHLSNASLKQPNRGIDNLLTSIGIYFDL